MEHIDKNNLYLNNQEYHLINDNELSEITRGWSDDNYFVISIDQRKDLLEMLQGKSMSDKEYAAICKKDAEDFETYLKMKQYAYVKLAASYIIPNQSNFIKQAYLVYPLINFTSTKQYVDREVFNEDILFIAEKYHQDFILNKLPKQSAKCLNCYGDVVIDTEKEKFVEVLNEYYDVEMRYNLFFSMEADKKIKFNGVYFSIPAQYKPDSVKFDDIEFLTPMTGEVHRHEEMNHG